MKDAYEVLYQKEADLVRVRQEVDSLRTVASLLNDQASADDPGAAPLEKRPVEAAFVQASDAAATGTEGPSSIQRPTFWEFLKPARRQG